MEPTTGRLRADLADAISVSNARIEVRLLDSMPVASLAPHDSVDLPAGTYIVQSPLAGVRAQIVVVRAGETVDVVLEDPATRGRDGTTSKVRPIKSAARWRPPADRERLAASVSPPQPARPMLESMGPASAMGMGGAAPSAGAPPKVGSAFATPRPRPAAKPAPSAFVAAVDPRGDLLRAAELPQLSLGEDGWLTVQAAGPVWLALGDGGPKHRLVAIPTLSPSSEARVRVLPFPDLSEPSEIELRGESATLAAWLQRRGLEGSRELALAAHRALLGKVQDPIAAALGALVLLRSDDRTIEVSWLENAARWFPDLPDGAVVLAEAHLRRGDAAQAIPWIQVALTRGPPVFSEALALLQGQIQFLDGLQDRSAVDAAMPVRSRLIDRIGRRAIRGALTVQADWSVDGLSWSELRSR